MLALYLMEQQGHEVTCLVNIVPRDKHSWVFHTPNLHLMPLMAESLGKDLVQVEGGDDEEGDLRSLSSALGNLDVDGVVTGALASDYQWDRINRVCDELGLRTFSPLWRKDPNILMDELVDSGIRAAIVAVMADGLGPEWLGRVLDDHAFIDLRPLVGKHRINIAGEGGEYETLTLDSPIHSKALVLDRWDTDVQRDSAHLTVTSAHLL